MTASDLEKELALLPRIKSFDQAIRDAIEGIPDTRDHEQFIYIKITALALIEILKQLEKMNEQKNFKGQGPKDSF